MYGWYGLHEIKLFKKDSLSITCLMSSHSNPRWTQPKRMLRSTGTWRTMGKVSQKRIKKEERIASLCWGSATLVPYHTHSRQLGNFWEHLFVVSLQEIGFPCQAKSCRAHIRNKGTWGTTFAHWKSCGNPTTQKKPCKHTKYIHKIFPFGTCSPPFTMWSYPSSITIISIFGQFGFGTHSFCTHINNCMIYS